MITGRQGIKLIVKRCFVRWFRKVKIKPRGTFITNATPGYRCGHNRAQHMHTTMQSHKRITTLPVYLSAESLALFQQKSFINNVPDRTTVAIFDGIQDSDSSPVLAYQPPGIPRLPATNGIEHGLIQCECVILLLNHLSITLLQVAVFSKKFFGHLLGCSACRGL